MDGQKREEETENSGGRMFRRIISTGDGEILEQRNVMKTRWFFGDFNFPQNMQKHGI